MIWRNVGPYTLRSEEVANVVAVITTFPKSPRYAVTVWRTWDIPDREDESRLSGRDCDMLDDAKAVALELMRAEVVRARGEAENTICHASRWLRANGGEP